MTRKILSIILSVFFAISASAQTFNYSFTTDNADNQNYSYSLNSTIAIVGIKITNVYFDNGTTGSFAYALVIKYVNTITGSNIPSTNFYTFQLDATSNTGQANLSNNFSIPISTATGALDIGNNPTYSGSASQLGYTAGNTYTDNTTLNRFGYFTLALTVGGPSLSNTKSSASGIILPILLNQFSATLQNDIVKINWSTVTETNTSSFVVERSADNKDFDDILQVAAHGNSNSIINYAATDWSPLLGTSFYRLKEIDINGDVFYSPITIVTNTKASINTVQIYPTINLANTVNISGNFIGKTLDVFSINGNKVFSTSLHAPQLALPVFPKGIYLFKVTAVDKSNQIIKYIQQ